MPDSVSMAVFDHVHAGDAASRAPAIALRTPSDLHPLHRLQRLAGNAAVSSLVAQRQEENLPTQSGGGGGGGTHMLTMVSLSRPGTISLTLDGSDVKDAKATIG